MVVSYGHFLAPFQQFKGELNSNHIFPHSSKTRISTPFPQDIYGLLFTKMNIF